MTRYDAFVSHSSLDKPVIIEELVRYLRRRGYRTWYDKHNILVGDNFNSKILGDLEKCNVFIAFLSRNFLDSRWTSYELGAFSATHQMKRILVVLHDISFHDACAIFPMLQGINLICYNGKKIELFEKIIESIDECNKNLPKHIQLELELFRLRDTFNHTGRMKYARLSRILDEFITIYYINKAMSRTAILTSIKYIEENIKKKNVISAEFMDRMQFIKNASASFSSMYDDISGEDKFVVILEEFVLMLKYIAEFNLLDIGLNHIGKSNFSIVRPDEFSRSDISRMWEIERTVLPHHLISPVEFVWKLYEHNNYTQIGIRDNVTKEIIGFISSCPISDELKENFLSGTITDVELPLDEIFQFSIPGKYTLYVSSFCVDIRYKCTKVSTAVYQAFIYMLRDLAEEKNIFISDLLVDAITKDGALLCKKLGMKKYGNTDHESTIYTAKLIPPTINIEEKNTASLIAYYRSKTAELAEEWPDSIMF